MKEFEKYAWEFVVGELLLTDNGTVVKLIKREREILEGVGEFIGMYLMVLPVENPDAPDVSYMRFNPYARMTGVQRKDSVFHVSL